MSKFYVGDRVLVHGHPYTLNQDEEFGVVEKRVDTGRRGDWVVLLDNYDGGDLSFYEHEMTLIPAPVTIEAGKFYKTRDGRKVGPASRFDDGWCMHSEGGRMWRGDGRRYFGDHPETDIVAEWVDIPAKPAGCAAAQVDNLRDEYGGAEKPKFKVGDRVRVIRHVNCFGDTIKMTTPVGAVRSIVKITDQVHGVQCCILSGDDVNFYTPGALELVAATTSPAIVILKEDGVLKPATRPFVHASRAEAVTEAKRLANSNKGKEFGVYELVDTQKVEKTYDHEWQRLAARGDKLGAIRELRRIAGMTLAASKRTVEEFQVAA